MSNPNQSLKAPKNALAAAAARKAAIASAPAADALDKFDENPDAEEAAKAAPIEPIEEAEPEVRTRKKAAQEAKEGGKKVVHKVAVKPTDDFVRNKKGEIRKDEEGEDMRYSAGFHKGVGFVNEAGVRFPVGFEFKGGFVGTFGNVILNRCPVCRHKQSVDSARSGKCDNERVPNGDGYSNCGYDQVREMEDIELA